MLICNDHPAALSPPREPFSDLMEHCRTKVSFPPEISLVQHLC